MPPADWKVTINARPEDVWPWVADLGRHADWSPKPYRVEWLLGEPNAVGSTFRSVGWLPQDKQHAMEGRVTVNEPFTKFEVKSSDSAGEVTNTFSLAPRGDTTTEVTRTMDLPPATGVAKVLMPVLFPMLIRPGVQKGMNLLKTKVEGSA